jgi:HK97 family phage portal protein
LGYIANKLSELRFSTNGIKCSPEWLVNAFGGVVSKAGATVSEESALGVSSVYSAIRLLAWTIASLPLPVYERLEPRGKVRATSHPMYKLLHDEPNSEQTSFEWRALMSVHQNLWGAGISEIEFDNQGRPVALWPIPPWCVVPKRTINKELVYEVTVDGQTKRLWPYQVLVFPALSTSRDCWKSPIKVHRETIGLSMAVKEFGASTFGQGTNPSAILSGLRFAKDDNEESVRKKFSDKYSGLGNSSRLMLLEDGVNFTRIGLPPEDAQYLESQKFNISEIARIYNIPLHLLQDHEKSTSWGSGIEEMNLGLITFTLRPYFVQWEQEIKRRLFSGEDRYFAEFLVEGLLRGKTKERFEAYKAGHAMGVFSIDDIREMENLNALPNGLGDLRMVPLNMQSIEWAKEKPGKANEPAKEGDTTNADGE